MGTSTIDDIELYVESMLSRLLSEGLYISLGLEPSALTWLFLLE